VGISQALGLVEPDPLPDGVQAAIGQLLPGKLASIDLAARYRREKAKVEGLEHLDDVAF
jgi:hypothetical protein